MVAAYRVRRGGGVPGTTWWRRTGYDVVAAYRVPDDQPLSPLESPVDDVLDDVDVVPVVVPVVDPVVPVVPDVEGLGMKWRGPPG